MATEEKKALRKMLLEKRDSTSYDLIKIASKQIFNKLRQMKIFQNASCVAAYYPIGSEVLTQDIIQDLFSHGKQVVLPKVVQDEIEFRVVQDLKSLEKGSYDIMEPKDDCPKAEKIDLVLVPTVGISKSGTRLGYGYGYYDRFLAKSDAKSVALTYQKQIIKSIPATDSDAKIDWVVSEDQIIDCSAVS